MRPITEPYEGSLKSLVEHLEKLQEPYELLCGPLKDPVEGHIYRRLGPRTPFKNDTFRKHLNSII